MKVFGKRNLIKALLAVSDVVVVILSSLFALILRFDIENIPHEYLIRACAFFPIYALAMLACMVGYRLYSGTWMYAGAREIIKIGGAALTTELLILASHVFLDLGMPRGYYIIQLILIFFGVTATRFSKRGFYAVKSIFSSNVKDGKRLMLVGTGNAADLLMREVVHAGTKGKFVCAIDDNPLKYHKDFHGIRVVGDRESIPEAVKRYGVEEIIIAMPSALAKDIKEIVLICHELDIPVKILPSIVKTLKNEPVYAELRPVNYEDLLGRDPVLVDNAGISEFIKDKTVLVTGGGGSIGSELCRQIAKASPKKLIIFDIYENNAYDIEQELHMHYPDLDLSVLIGSVRDYDRLVTVFEKYRPQIVYHAAAHKHVPLMEKSPNEAIKNNCQGTKNLCKVSADYEVENFILISTDKAVRPTNVMGASKRICEMIMQIYSRKNTKTRFAAVRFGNVLGSNGSVIPLFLRQIKEGGPVTVTHEKVVRFFMTIPEAVSLVLQASLYAKGGEIFVLDMGAAVKIYELAENLIKLQGLKPHEDIEIKVTGLRPGEKLYEEILMDEEGLTNTNNRSIFVGHPIDIPMGDSTFLDALEELFEQAQTNGHVIKEQLECLCPTYHITDNIVNED